LVVACRHGTWRGRSTAAELAANQLSKSAIEQQPRYFLASFDRAARIAQPQATIGDYSNTDLIGRAFSRNRTYFGCN